MVLWQEALRQRLHAASSDTDDLDTVRIYVEVAMGLVADGHHPLVVLLTMQTLAEDASPVVRGSRRGRRPSR